LFPALEIAEQYNDNIFAAGSDLRSDTISLIKPSVELKSDWSSHALRLVADGAIARYSRNSSEDYKDYSLAAEGRLDLARNSYLYGHLKQTELHEERSSPDDVGALTPTQYTVFSGTGGYFRRFNRLSMRLDVARHELDFKGISNNDRDRVETTPSLRIGYDTRLGHEVFMRVAANKRTYRQRVDDLGFQRSSEGYEITIGTRPELSGITFGDVFVGYVSQDYDDPGLSTIEDIIFGGSITWNPSRLTTFTGSASRIIEETTLGSASGIRATRLELTADHELLRNLILSAAISTKDEEYEGIDRSDKIFAFRAGAKYMLSRHLYLTFGWERERRDSGITPYKINAYTLQLRVQL